MVIENCNLCPRSCGAYRSADGGDGFCKMGADPVVARAALHFWEEPCISGTRGSGAVFFTGCSLKCAYCQNYEISIQKKYGRKLSPEKLAEVFGNLAEQGAHNINLVTATHFVPAVIKALTIWKPTVPVVYNCSGYEKISTLKMLEGFVDIYLADFKYSDGDAAKKYSGAADYPETAKEAITEMVRQSGEAAYDENGIMKKGTIIRQLILPGHTRNSIDALKWISEKFPKGVPVSLMAQYTPCGRAKDFPEINRRVTKREFEKVQDFLFSLGLDGYVQDISSAKAQYIPLFSSLEGVPQN